jgi:hypothetical protein
VEYSEPANEAPTTMSTIAATSSPTSAAPITSAGGSASSVRPWVIGRLTTNSSAISVEAITAVTANQGSERTEKNFVRSARNAAAVLTHGPS